MKVPSYDEFTDAAQVFDRMDTDLHWVVRKSRQELSEDHIQCFMHQLMIGLKYLKQCNVLHRDLKPENLLVTEDCTLKVRTSRARV